MTPTTTTEMNRPDTIPQGFQLVALPVMYPTIIQLNNQSNGFKKICAYLLLFESGTSHVEIYLYQVMKSVACQKTGYGPSACITSPHQSLSRQ